MTQPILPPPIHPAPDDTNTCDDLPSWARTKHPAPVREHSDDSPRVVVDAWLRAAVGTATAPVRFSVLNAHAAVASDDGGVTWWACASRSNGRFVARSHPTLSDASAWAWEQVRP